MGDQEQPQPQWQAVLALGPADFVLLLLLVIVVCYVLPCKLMRAGHGLWNKATPR